MVHLDPETGSQPVVDRLSAAKQALLSQWRRGRAVPAAQGIPRRAPGEGAPRR